MNGSTCWTELRVRLETLRNLDRQCEAFGAECHRYELRPVLSPEELGWAEEALGGALPEALRRFYLEMGDGGAGPGYGVFPSGELRGYRAGHVYPGLEALTRAAVAAEWEGGEGTCLQLPEGVLAGVAGIIHDGCGTETGMILNGPKAGELVRIGADREFAEMGKTLCGLYGEWLDEVRGHFQRVEGWMRSGATLEEIKDRLRERPEEEWVCSAGTTIASIADVAKPVELFGDPRHGSRIVHGAIQNPWFEEVLRDWQVRHLGES